MRTSTGIPPDPSPERSLREAHAPSPTVDNGRVIRSALPADAPHIARIYHHYVLHSTATFEVEPVTAAHIAARIARVQEAGLPWLVAERSGVLLGYAYAAPFRERAAFAHTLESSVYLDPQSRGAGLGRALYQELLATLAALTGSVHAPVRTVIGAIALPHPASVALHESLGFTPAGTLTAAGRKFGQWVDLGYWQLDMSR